MSYGSARQARTTETTEKDYSSTRRSVKPAQEVSAFGNIETNTFHRIIIQGDLSAEQKMEEAARALEFNGAKEENRARIKEFEAFKEYMHHVSEEMSKQRIGLTDTGTYAELQRVYGEFNDDLQNFIDAMTPLTDITDSIYKLRQSGQTREALRMIKEDRAWDEEHSKEVIAITADIARLEQANLTLASASAALAQDKGFFGYGAIKPASMGTIKANEVTVEANDKELARLRGKFDELTKSKTERMSGRTVDNEDVNRLRELLDISGENHTKRQADLVGRALAFVNNGKARFGSIRGHLDKMVGQIEGLGDNNGNMVQIYAVLNEATKRAEKGNQAKREALTATPEEENLIEKMKREKSQQEINEHVEVLSTAAVDTMQAYAELTAEAIKISNMQAATKKQVHSARTMHSRGIASVASQLSTVMTAVNSAAINEAQAMAASTLSAMAKVTNEVAMKESIRIATGRDEVNHDLEAMLEELAAFGDVQKEATDITRDALERMRSNMDDLERMSRDVGEDTKAFVAVAANVVAGTGKPKPAVALGNAVKSPFQL